MPLNHTQPDISDAGLFPVAAGALRGKMRQKYRGLGYAVARVWEATINSDVSMCPDGVTIDCEQVVIDAAAALVIVRTIDGLFQKMLTGVDRRRYEQMQTDDLTGRVVRGLVLPRNADVHAESLLTMDSPRLMRGDGRGGWRVFPRWPTYDDLPVDIRTGGRTALSAHHRYQDSVGGRLVIETLLDAVRFFDRCDPSLMRRTPTGELDGFPLRAFIEHDYEQRHPYWPSWDEVNNHRLDRLVITAPTGTGREIHRAITVDDTVLLTGWTGLGSFYHWSFVESAEQVIWDVAGGYRYTALTDDGDVLDVTVDGGDLRIGGIPLDAFDMAMLAGDPDVQPPIDDAKIVDDWKGQVADAWRYRDHRRST